MMMPAAVPLQLPVGKCFLINVWIPLLKTPRLGGFQIREARWKAGIYSGEVTVARETHLAAIAACVFQFSTLTRWWCEVRYCRGISTEDSRLRLCQRRESRVCFLQHGGVKALGCSAKDTQTWKILKRNTSKDFHQGREERTSWRASEIYWIGSKVSCFWERKKNRRDSLTSWDEQGSNFSTCFHSLSFDLSWICFSKSGTVSFLAEAQSFLKMNNLIAWN